MKPNRKSQIRNRKIRNFQILICSRRSQIRMMETMAVLLVFFLIVIIGFLFVIRLNAGTQDVKINQIQELESIQVSQAISFLPELQCSSKNIISDNCIDIEKLNAFDSSNNDVYYPLLYFSVIEIYNVPNDPLVLKESWGVYNRSKNTSAYVSLIPISLKDPVTGIHSFGVLNVTYYSLT